MANIYEQEIFKIIHKKSTWYSLGIVFILMLMVALFSLNSLSLSDRQFYFSSAYGGYQWSLILIIIISSSFITMEFEYGTIKQLIIQTNTRSSIYFAKLMVIIVYDFLIHIGDIIFTIIIKLILQPKLSLNQIYMYHQSLLNNLLINAVLDILTSFVVISIVLCLASMATNSAASVAIGIGFCFLGEGLSSFLISGFSKFFPQIKWNPFNMLNVQNQYGNPEYFHTTHLTLSQLMGGNMVWTIVFLIIGMWIFSRREV